MLRRFKKWSFGQVVEQLKQNTVAIISLLTAIFGLTYNTWLDEHNEINHNMRIAAFEVLQDLGELQTIVNYAHFTKDSARGHPIEGWKHALMVRDLTKLLPKESATQGEYLYARWESDWEKLMVDAQSEARISAQIAKTRQSVLNTIDQLE